MNDVKESQQTGRFSTHTREYLLNSAFPNAEIETLAGMLSAPFYAIEQGILVRIAKGERLAPKPGEIGITYGPPLKRVHVPPGIKARVTHAVHEELGHAGRDITYSTIKQRFDWPTMYRDTVTPLHEEGKYGF